MPKNRITDGFQPKRQKEKSISLAEKYAQLKEENSRLYLEISYLREFQKFETIKDYQDALMAANNALTNASIESRVRDRRIKQLIAQLSAKDGEYALAKEKTAKQIAEEMVFCKNRLDAVGNNNRHVFKQKLAEVSKAIYRGEPIGGIDIFERVKDPSFRFYTQDQPVLSLEVSGALAKVAALRRTAPPELLEIGTKKRIENADEYARQMFDEIRRVQEEAGVTSFRKTVAELTAQNVPTPNGGKWSTNTLQDLHKRWKKLGLMPLPPDL